MQEQRLIWVDRMRGLAILSVVIQHLTYYYQNEFVYHKFIGISNMAVFFFISGFIWEKTAKVNTAKEGLSYLWKKTIQIMLPFIVWTFLVYPYFFQTNWKVWSFKEIVNEFTEPHLWFLLTLYGYCFYFVAFRLINRWGGVKSGVAFWTISFIVLGAIWYKFGIFKLAALYMPYFAIGTLVPKNNIMETVSSNKFVTTIALSSIFLLMNFWNSGHTSLTNIALKVLVSLATILIVYVICTKLNWNRLWDCFIIECGKCSLAIYIMHWSFLHIFDEKPMIVQNELIAFVPILVIAVIICYACMLLKNIIQLFPTADLVLFGNKKRR